MRNKDRKAPQIESGIPVPPKKKPRKVPTDRPASVIRETVDKMQPGDSIKVAAFEQAGYTNWIRRRGFDYVTKREGRIRMSTCPSLLAEGDYAAVRIWMVEKMTSENEYRESPKKSCPWCIPGVDNCHHSQEEIDK